MALIQIVTANGELEAANIKGILENLGIKATFAPGGYIGNTAGRGASQPHIVYVEDFDKDNALDILIKQGLVTPQSI